MLVNFRNRGVFNHGGIISTIRFFQVAVKAFDEILIDGNKQNTANKVEELIKSSLDHLQNENGDTHLEFL